MDGALEERPADPDEGVDKAYGVSRSMHSVDGADHFRFRKSLQPAYARSVLTRRGEGHGS